GRTATPTDAVGGPGGGLAGRGGAWSKSGRAVPAANLLERPKDPLDILGEVFGHAAFRGQQQAVVEHVIAGGDAVVLFPTGAGKSICFQVPALCRPGVAIVISPLIALMRDQVEALRQAGVAAAALNSSITAAEADEVRRQLRAGELDLLY